MSKNELSLSSRATIERAIADRASSDADFRAKLLSDPKSTVLAVIESHIPGFVMPEDMSFEVLADDQGGVCISFPFDGEELSLEEMEMAAGGVGNIISEGNVIVQNQVTSTGKNNKSNKPGNSNK